MIWVLKWCTLCWCRAVVWRPQRDVRGERERERERERRSSPVPVQLWWGQGSAKPWPDDIYWWRQQGWTDTTSLQLLLVRRQHITLLSYLFSCPVIYASDKMTIFWQGRVTFCDFECQMLNKRNIFCVWCTKLKVHSIEPVLCVGRTVCFYLLQ